MAKPRSIAVIDAETDPFRYGRVPEPFAWGLFDGESFRSWWNDQPGFVAALSELDAIVYAHNGGKFDFHFLADSFDTSRAPSVINGRLVKVHVGKAELRDSWCIAPMPLAAYQKETINYDWFESDQRDNHRGQILRYLESDCRYLHALVSAFLDDNPGHPLTLAQAGMRALKLHVGNVPTSSQSFDAMFRSFYFGGRCEPFKRGSARARFKVYDINSAYPWAMLDAHPWGVRYSSGNRLPTNEAMLRASFAEIDAESFGALPRRLPHGGLSFPHDEPGYPSRYYASGHEILSGLETNTLRLHRVEIAHTWPDTLSLAPYVDTYYTRKRDAKKRGDKLAEITAKLMLNGVYGKFAQRGDLQFDWHWSTSPVPDPEADMFYKVGPFDLIGYRKLGRFYNVATAASITAQVRAYLWRTLCTATDPIYCDTDSIAAAALPGVTVSEALGAWKLEATCDQYHVAGKKLYAFHETGGDWKIASKGVRLTPAEIARVARGETVEYRSPSPTMSVASPARFITRKVRRT